MSEENVEMVRIFQESLGASALHREADDFYPWDDPDWTSSNLIAVGDGPPLELYSTDLGDIKPRGGRSDVEPTRLAWRTSMKSRRRMLSDVVIVAILTGLNGDERHRTRLAPVRVRSPGRQDQLRRCLDYLPKPEAAGLRE